MFNYLLYKIFGLIIERTNDIKSFFDLQNLVDGTQTGLSLMQGVSKKVINKKIQIFNI